MQHDPTHRYFQTDLAGPDHNPYNKIWRKRPVEDLWDVGLRIRQTDEKNKPRLFYG